MPEESSDYLIEMMENVKKFLAAAVVGYNYDINAIDDDALDVGDLED